MAQLDTIYYLLSKRQLYGLLIEMAERTEQYQQQGHGLHAAAQEAFADLLLELNNNETVDAE